MKRDWTPKQPGKTTQDKAYVNVRLLDPASNLDMVCDSTGGLITRGEKVSEIGPKIFENGISDDIEVIDCLGQPVMKPSEGLTITTKLLEGRPWRSKT